MTKARSRTTTARPARTNSNSNRSTGTARSRRYGGVVARTSSQRPTVAVARKKSSSARPASSPGSRQRVHPSRQEQLRRRLAYQQAQAQAQAQVRTQGLDSDPENAAPLAYPWFGTNPKTFLSLTLFQLNQNSDVLYQLQAAEEWIRSNWVPVLNSDLQIKSIKAWWVKVKKGTTHCEFAKAVESHFRWKSEPISKTPHGSCTIDEIKFEIPLPRVCDLVHYSGFNVESKGWFEQIFTFHPSFCFTEKIRQIFKGLPSKQERAQLEKENVESLLLFLEYLKGILAMWMYSFFKLIQLLFRGPEKIMAPYLELTLPSLLNKMNCEAGIWQNNLPKVSIFRNPDPTGEPPFFY